VLEEAARRYAADFAHPDCAIAGCLAIEGTRGLEALKQ
jgi:hypothetical protein